MLIRLTIFIGIAILFFPAAGMAGMEQWLKNHGGPYMAEERDLPYLPEYCRCRIASNKDRYKHEGKKWSRIFSSKGERGRDWVHVHHYCHGLLMLSRLYRGLGTRSALLNTAEAEFNYMLQHASPKFILMPEIHLKMGITQKLMGKDGKAMEHFMKAIKLKKDYVIAYVHIIDYYKERHDFKNAIRIAQEGLKYSPKSKILRKELVELQSLSTTK